MIQLLAVDMDGTCLNSKSKMSDNTLKALKKAAEKGITVVPTTGRNITCLPIKIKNENFYRYVISSNGALAVDLKDNTEIFKSYIDSKTAAEILEKCKKMGIFIAAHIDRDFYVQGRLVYCAVKQVLGKDASVLKYVKSMAEVAKDSSKHIEEFQFFYFGDRYREKIKDIIEPYEDVCSAHSKGYAEIYNKKGSKGTALLALAKHLGISADEIGCIGDEENDISMFDVAGKRFAMGNAIEQLKNKADVILPTNDEDGVAEAVNKYILGVEAR